MRRGLITPLSPACAARIGQMMTLLSRLRDRRDSSGKQASGLRVVLGLIKSPGCPPGGGEQAVVG